MTKCPNCKISLKKVSLFKGMVKYVCDKCGKIVRYDTCKEDYE